MADDSGLSAGDRRMWHDYVQDLGKQVLSVPAKERQSWLDEHAPPLGRYHELLLETIVSFPAADRDALHLMFPSSPDEPPHSSDEIEARTGRSDEELKQLGVALIKKAWARRLDDAEYQQLLEEARLKVLGH
jgi:hypothetical protein